MKFSKGFINLGGKAKEIDQWVTMVTGEASEKVRLFKKNHV